MSTESPPPGVVVELQTNRWPFLPRSRTAFATGCIALSKNSLEKLPSGRLGDGTMKNEASVSTASFGLVEARQSRVSIGDSLREQRLLDRRFARVELAHEFGIDVHAQHFKSSLGEGRGHARAQFAQAKH